MKNALVFITLLTSCMAFASEDLPTEQEIKMNYIVACGSFDEIQTVAGKPLSPNDKAKAIETRILTLDILARGQDALNQQGRYANWACISIAVAKDLIVKNGCTDLRTGEKVQVEAGPGSGVEVCEQIIKDGNLPGF